MPAIFVQEQASACDKSLMKMISIAAISAALAVALGAFGAHALKARVSGADLLIWQTAVNYHIWHSLALLALGVWFRSESLKAKPAPQLLWSARSLLLGIIIFSGSLYLLVLTNLRWLGAITPLGGVAFILGWLLLAKAAWQDSAEESL